MSLVSKIFSPNGLEEGKISDDLLDRLFKQHRGLNRQQKAIEEATLGNAADIKNAAALITSFKKNFEAHVLLEQISFYNHLEQLFSDKPAQLRKLKKYRQELNGVINRVLHYCNHYKTAQKIRQGQDSFLKDSIQIRKLVKHQNRVEERELFPIYENLH